MKVLEIKDILKANVLLGEEYLNREVTSACGADLMSDVLAFVKDQSVLLTGLVNLQVIRTAEMMDMHVIVFVRGKKPTEDIIDLAATKEMIVMCTEYPMYIACGKLYESGLYNRQ